MQVLLLEAPTQLVKLTLRCMSDLLMEMKLSLTLLLMVASSKPARSSKLLLKEE